MTAKTVECNTVCFLTLLNTLAQAQPDKIWFVTQ